MLKLSSIRRSGDRKLARLLMSVAGLTAGYASMAQGATFSASYIGVATGTYNVAANWSGGTVPNTNSPAAGDFWNITIDRAGGSNVTATGSFEVLNLTLGAANQLSIPSLSNFAILGTASAGTATVANSGTINVVGGVSGATLRFRSSFTNLTGTGTISLIGPAVIRGEGGTLSTSNRIIGSGTLGLGSLTIINAGTILSQGSILNLLPHPTSGFINQNLMSAGASSTLRLGTGTYTNSGTIQSLGTGTIAIIDAVRINGGTINVASLGNMLVQTPAATFSGVQVVNNGSLFLNNPGVASTIRLGGTLSGSGVTTLGGVPGATLTLASTGAATFLTNNSTIRGNGVIGLAGTGLINNAGTITANQPGDDLTLGNGVSINNTGGTISASAGTIRLAFTPGTSVTGSGTIQASGTGSIQFGNNVTLIGQTLVSSGSGAFAPVPAGGVLTLTNVTNNATLTHGGGTLAISAPSMTNNGVITMRTDGSVPGAVQLSNNTTVTLNGTGRLVLDALSVSGAPHIASTGTLPGTLVNTAGHTIEGEGTIGVGSLAIRNAGTIIWNGNTRGMTINPTLPSGGSVGLVNTGDIIAAANVSGAALTINTPTGIDNTGGRIGMFSSSTLVFNGGGTVTGGLVSMNGTTQVNGGTLTLAGVLVFSSGTISGSSPLVSTGGTIEVTGDTSLLNPLLISNGTINSGTVISPIRRIVGGPGATIENNGTIVADGNPLGLTSIDLIDNFGLIHSRLKDLRIESNTRIEGNGTLQSDGGFFVFDDAVVIGNTLISTASRPFQVEAGGVNLSNATISTGASMTGPGSMSIGLTGTVENRGTIRAPEGVLLTLRPANSATTHLTGTGEVRPTGGGTLEITGTGTLQSTNHLNFLLGGHLRILSRALINDGTITAPLSISSTGTTLFRNNGRIEVNGATSLALAQPLENNGRVNISTSGTLALSANITGGTIANSGGRIEPVGALRELNNVNLFNNNVFVIGTAVLNTTGQPLRLTNSTVINTGFIGPFSGPGGSVEFVGGTVNNNNGTLSTYALRASAAVTGGRLIGHGSVSLGSIGNVTNTGTLNLDSLGILTLTGNVVNFGQVNVFSSAALVGGGTVVLSGTGTLTGGGNGQLGGNGTLVNGSDHRLIAAGNFTLGDGTLEIRNSGRISSVAAGTLTLLPGPTGLQNAGTIGATALGAAVTINPGIIHNTGGSIQALDGTLTLNNSTVIGGELFTNTMAPTGLVRMSLSGASGSGTLVSVINRGSFLATGSSATLTLNLVGSIANPGTLDLRTNVSGASASLENSGYTRIGNAVVAGIGTITGTGTVVVSSVVTPTTLSTSSIRAGRIVLDAPLPGLSSVRVNLGSSMTDVSRVNGIDFPSPGTGASTFNIAASTLVYDYTGASPFVAVRQRITSGYNAGAWNGPGIISNLAAATPGRGVGYAEATDLFVAFPAMFVGETIDDTALLLRYTLLGDADLSGSVNLDDFTRLAASFGLSAAWSGGDFNYDGAVNLDDFTALAANFGQTLPADAARASVPEPGGAFILGAGLARWRRRDRSNRVAAG